MEHLIIPLSFDKKNFVEEKDFFTFKGLAAAFGNIDFNGDRLHKGATIETIAERKVSGKFFPCLWMHDTAQPLGIFTDLEELTEGLLVSGKLPKEDTVVHGRIIPQMKIGSIQELSLGFIAEEWFFDDDGIRNLTKIKIIEISLITAGIAANDRANVTEMKSIDCDSFLKLTEREMEKKFKEGVILTGSGAKKLISALKKSGALRDEAEPKHRDDVINWAEMKASIDKLNTKVKG